MPIYEKMFGKDHFLYASLLEFMGEILYLQRKGLHRAMRFYEDALRIRIKNANGADPRIVQTQIELDAVYDELAIAQKAEMLLLRVIDDYRINNKTGDANLALALNNLAYLYKKQG